MGARGPAPKPTALKRLQGTDRADRSVAGELSPAASAPSPPSILGREGKREWKRVVKAAEGLGLLTQLDRSVMLRYCQAYEEFWLMSIDIEEHGVTQITSTGYEALRPQVTVRNQALARMQKAEAELGMTPSARTRISVAPPKQERANPFLDAARGAAA